MAEHAAGAPAEGEAIMHEARKDPSMAEHHAHSAVLRPFHAAIDRAMASHFQDVFEGDDPAERSI
jgi:hypothetical protein